MDAMPLSPQASQPSRPSSPEAPQVRPGTPSLLRELNDRAALDLLLGGEPLTRAQISERTGVSKVTVSQMLTRLEERGLVTVAGAAQAGGRGPNAALYSVVPSSAYVAGLYIESGLVSAAVADVTGRRIAEISVDPNGGEPVSLVRDVVARACLSAGIEPSRLSALVIGSPGVLDPSTGDPRLAVNLPAWHEGVLDGLREVLHKPVVIENDVNLAAMAERAAGAAAGLDDFALVWLGVGLGLATVLGGQVRRGVAGAAGEIGWLPVHGAPLPTNREHPAGAGFQYLAGGMVVRALAAEHGFTAASAGEAVAAAVAAAGGRAQSASGPVGGTAQSASGPVGGTAQSASGPAFLDELAHRVAIGVASVCVVLDPGLVVLGGEVGRAGGSVLADRVAQEVSRICLARPRVVPTAVPGEPVLRGAMLAALAQAHAALLASVADPQLAWHHGRDVWAPAGRGHRGGG
jgi:predicted NBD/HSP70 family sugar kinase